MGNLISSLFGGSSSIDYQQVAQLDDADITALNKVNRKNELNNQTREICSKEFIRVSSKLKSNQLINQYFDDVSTLYDGFMRGCRVAGDKPCLGTRPNQQSDYQWLTYNQVKDTATNFGSGLINTVGLRPNNDQLVGIYAKNCSEWVVAEKALIFYNMCLVPMYDTLGDQAMRYICQQTDLECMIIHNGKALSEFERDVLKFDEGRGIKKIVIIERSPADADLIKRTEDRGITIFNYKDLVANGQGDPQPHNKPSPKDTTVINYTSGTTGNPKGVMLTHENFVSDASAAYYMLPRPFRASDAWFSYLPLPHVFERTVQICLMMVGAQIGFFSGDIRNMPSDLGKLRPTIFGGVPRIWTRFYDKIVNAGQGSWLKTKLINMAIASKVKDVEKGVIKTNTIWDKIVFNKVTGLLGGRVEIAVTGAAPIAPEILNVLRAAFGAYIIEGYGQTECAAACTATFPGDHSGTVGAPLVCNQIKLDDVADMNYYAKDGKGEICVRGSNVMKGYYKNKEKTDETVDKDGWLHTGDIGTWTATGALKIIDRKKNIFKLAQGEYIAPEKIENVYVRASPVMQVYVHGESLQAQLVAIVVPDPETFPAWCGEKGINDSFKNLCKNGEVKKLVMKDMNDLGKQALLKSFELAKAIHLESEPWTVDMGLLTPTFKSKRPQLRKHYESEIAEMYNVLNK